MKRKNPNMQNDSLKSGSRLREQSAFTRLQQLMTAILLMVILFIGSYAFIGYRKAAYQLKADTVAQKVYGSAESYMHKAAEENRLDELNGQALKFGGKLTKTQKKQLYPKQNKTTPIYYICMESEQTAKNRKKNPIQEILNYQIEDQNVRKHTFLIEYNGNTGEILSAFYSEKVDFFTYQGKKEAKENVIIRDRAALNKKWQGYCTKGAEEIAHEK